MPYLTSTRAHAAGTTVRTGLGIPGYAHPLLAPLEWDRLTRPGAPVHWAVLNVAAGPGTRPDPRCLEAAGRLRNTGVRVLGHLDTVHGARAFGELVGEASRYLDWYQVDGFLLDRCPADRSDLQEIRRIVATLRALLSGGGHIVLGLGTHPHPGYAGTADQLVTFSGAWSDYRFSRAPQWTAEYPPEYFCHLVHGLPQGHLEDALRIARWQGAATIYFTDRTGGGARGEAWETLPGYWDEIVSRLGTRVSE